MPGKVNHRELATTGGSRPGTGPPCTLKLGATLPLAERAGQAESSGLFRVLRDGTAKQGKPAPRPRLYKKKWGTKWGT